MVEGAAEGALGFVMLDEAVKEALQLREGPVQEEHWWPVTARRWIDTPFTSTEWTANQAVVLGRARHWSVPAVRLSAARAELRTSDSSTSLLLGSAA